MRTIAKLPSGDAPGWKNKSIVEEGRFGDVTLWSLEGEKDDRHRNIFAIVNGVLVAVASANQVELQPERVPTSMAVLEDLLRESVSTSDRPGFSVVWEALGLPLAARDEKVKRSQQAREQRQNERQETFDRQRREETEKAARGFEETAANVMAGDAVSGKSLYELARHIDLKVNPRAAGSFKDGNLTSVSSDRGTGTTNAIIGAGIKLYREVQAKLKGAVPS